MPKRATQKTKPALPPKPPKKPIGHPPYLPTKEDRARVEFMAGIGIPQDQISRVIYNATTKEPISETTLKKYFHEELQTGMTKANVHVMGNLYKHTQKHHGAAIFWAKARLGWKDRHFHQPGGGDTPPITPEALDALQMARRVAFMLAAGAHQKAKVKA